jgi:Asp-tRNA(Asn)/Glu-tRNA(Gln) amidotransferase C subunit
MMDEFYKKFEQECMQETIQKIANVVEQINECDIPRIEKFIGYLESNPSM